MSKQANVVEIKNVEVKEAKDGRNYKYCEVTGYETVVTRHPITGAEITTTGKVVRSATNIWASQPNNGPANPDYDLWNKGSFKAGMIIRKEVTPYEIPANGDSPARTVNTASVLVIGDSTEPDWQERIKLAFLERGFTFTKAEVKEEEEKTVLNG